MLVSMHPRFAVHRFAGPAILAGSLVFSGSIFGLVLGPDALRPVLGPITPIGGTVLMAGCVCRPRGMTSATALATADVAFILTDTWPCSSSSAPGPIVLTLLALFLSSP
jgi:uncharacterized membrane protein YgdD (TMEM256/DUF423 family)